MKQSYLKQTASLLLEDIKLYSIIIKKLKNTPHYAKYEATLNAIGAEACA